MSFIGNETGKAYAPGWFLAHEECERKTYEISQEGAATADNGGKYVKMGTVYPANGSSAIGIVYEDVDVTSGNMPGSVVTRGTVYEDRLPEKEEADLLTEEMEQFCSEFAVFEKKLEQLGVLVGKRIALMPPSPEVASLINVEDYSLTGKEKPARLSVRERRRNHCLKKARRSEG